MPKAIVFTVNASNFDADRFKASREAQQKADKLRDDFILEFRKSERFKAARDLAKTSDYGGGKIEPVVTLSSGVFTVHLQANEIDKSAKPMRPHVNIDPKLANALLNGKLLTDAEKRGLIESIAPGVLHGPEDDPALENPHV